MMKIFSRFQKTKQVNQTFAQNLQDNNLQTPNFSANEINSNQQINNSQENITLQEIAINDDDQERYINSANDRINNAHIHNLQHPQSVPIIKHAFTLPQQIPTFYYTVKEGDTIQSISDQFHVKKSLIKKANRIYDESKLHAGEVIQLFTETDESLKSIPIIVSVYDIQNQADGISGKLCIKKHDLIFSRKSFFRNHHKIDLGGYLESDVFPHPTQSNLYILVINYLKDPRDKSTSVSEYFSGQKEDLDRIRIEIIKTADLAQEKVNYVAPNPDSIFYSQEFADTAGVHQKKRRGTGAKGRPRFSSASVHTMKVFLPQIQCLNGHSDIIKKTDIFLVRKKLPVRFQNANWTLLYKSAVDGKSLATFYRKVTSKKPALFFLKTVDGEVIGAFIPSGLAASTVFYGGVDTFVFRFRTETGANGLYITKLADSSDQISTEKVGFDVAEGGNSEKKDDNGSQISSEKEKLDVTEEDKISSEENGNAEVADQNEVLENNQKEAAHFEVNDENNGQDVNDHGECQAAAESGHKEKEKAEASSQSAENSNEQEEGGGEFANSKANDEQNAESIGVFDDQESNQNTNLNSEESGCENSESNDPEEEEEEIADENEKPISETNDQNADSQANHEPVNDQSKCDDSNASADKDSQKTRTVIDAYKWSRVKNYENRNFVFSNHENILFGGGDSSAIFIDKDMYNGYSDPCATFDSPRLTKRKKFGVSMIEVWQVF